MSRGNEGVKSRHWSSWKYFCEIRATEIYLL